MTMSRNVIRSIVRGTLLASVLSLTPLTASADTRIYVRLGPPALRYERVTRRPVRGYVWVPGYYTWAGTRYDWVGGRWDRPPYVGARWEPHRWSRNHHGWYHTEGRWRR